MNAQGWAVLACVSVGASFASPLASNLAAWGQPARTAPAEGLRLVATYPLPGPANRFDYQSLDEARRRLYLNHMNAGHLLVFDVDGGRVVQDVGGVPRATGVLAVPQHHEVYVSAAGAHAVVVFDDRTMKEVARVDGIRFPDGIAFDPVTDRVFVSDESGSADVAIDARTHRRLASIPLGGEAGNTHYDSVARRILVAVQTRNELVTIDPAAMRIVARYPLAGSDHPHGFALDAQSRIAFVTGEGNAELMVVDLRTMKILSRHRVGDEPDVLAWDPSLHRLYVASEGGVLSAFRLEGTTLVPAGEYRAPHAHTVSVDPRTHRIYLPLENVNGRPELRVLAPH